MSDNQSTDNFESNGVTPIRISLRRKTIPVELELEDGKVVNWSLKEMTGGQRDAFLNITGKRMKTNRTGTSTIIKNYEGLHAELICRCLYDDQEKPVSKSFVQTKINSYAQAVLYAQCRELCGLTEEAQEAEKND